MRRTLTFSRSTESLAPLVEPIKTLFWRFSNRSLKIILLILTVAAVIGRIRAGEPDGSAATAPLRFAFSSRMFSAVNENDAKASVKAWALALARERGVHMDTQPVILENQARFHEAIRTASIDGAAVTTQEYLDLEPELQGTNLFLTSNAGKFTEEYQLVVRADSKIEDLGGLRGHRIVFFDNPRASLALLWLETLLAEKGLGFRVDEFARVSKEVKLTKVVVPVFFHQQEACVVTRRGFETVRELNPQVGSQLRVLATSRELVPALGFIRQGYNSPLRDALFAALRGLEKSAAGTQVLTLFQSDELHQAHVSLLDSARDLVNQHRRLAASAIVKADTGPEGDVKLGKSSLP